MITDTVPSPEKKSEQEMPPSITETKENGGKEVTEKPGDVNVPPPPSTDNATDKKPSPNAPATETKQSPVVDTPEKMEEDGATGEEDEAPAPAEKKKQTPKKAPPPKKETPKKEPAAKKETESKNETAAKPPPAKREKREKADKAEKAAEGAEGGEKQPALFDSPLVVQGKRQRHSVDRLTATATPYQVKHTKADIPSGSGTKLADIEYISALISRTKPDELKHLHRLLFGRPGTSHEVRKNIRAFNGFSFASGSAEYEKKKATMEKMTKSDLLSVATLLGTEKSKDKPEIATKILEFLLKPADTGRAAPGKKTKRKSGTKRKRTTPKAKKEKKAKKASGEEEKAAASSDEEESSGDEEEEEKEEDDDDEGEEEEEEKPEPEEPPAKKAKAAPKKEAPKKEAPKKEAPKKESPKKESPKKESPKKAPPPKKQAAPSDAELTAAIKELLKDANLEEVTMKEMCKMVYDKYPDLDLTERKDFIKTTVKSIIATSNE